MGCATYQGVYPRSQGVDCLKCFAPGKRECGRRRTDQPPQLPPPQALIAELISDWKEAPSLPFDYSDVFTETQLDGAFSTRVYRDPNVSLVGGTPTDPRRAAAALISIKSAPMLVM